MIKDIKYSGYSTQPSDYECPDGSLAGMLNLIPEDNTLKPIFPPKPILDCNLGGTVRIIHHVHNQNNYIIVRSYDNTDHLFWLEKNADNINETNAKHIGDFNHLKDIEIIGNTLILATDDGIRYVLWRNDNYVTLADRPPFVCISFGNAYVSTCEDQADLDITFESGPLNTVFLVDSEENSNAILGLLLSSVREHITSHGYFYMPFFVRYAYRLFDGSYSWHSNPILMLPMVVPPVIKTSVPFNAVGGLDLSPGVHTIPIKLSVPYFSLCHKIMPFGESESFDDWRDIVAGIDIFVSAPIYTYDQSKRIKGLGSFKSLISNAYFDWNPDNTPHKDPPEKFFVGHYSSADRFLNYFEFTDHFMDSASGGSVFLPQTNDHFHEDIMGTNLFYKISSIGFDSIKPMDDYKELHLDTRDFDNLVTRPTLPDDFQSHCRISPDFLHAYNSRLNMAGINILPAPPLPLASALDAATSTDPDDVSITVFTKTNGILCHSVANVGAWDLQNYFPRYIFYPDASAYKMVISSAGKDIILDLKSHDFLNGAFWYGSLDISAKPQSNADPESRQTFSSVPIGNKIYSSEVNNPFYFPVNGITSVGFGSVLGLSSAARALSQGQFGQFPLYAFTSEGIWALEVGSNGFFSARQPITRDVCINPAAICQIDSAVIFPSARGVILLSGSNSSCISDIINSDSPFNPSSLFAFDKLVGFPNSHYDYFRFVDFLKNAHILYDYPNQRIIVAGNHEYAFVFSLKSKHWGIMADCINSVVRSYPEALAMSTDNKLVDLSSSDEDVAKGLLVSRPLKLETPDVLKTIDTVIQRGHFQKGHVRSLLYGSRDLYHWHLVWSSKDHYLRGFRGTPYKYFRIALLCNLYPDESIFGASIQFNPRLTNQPR